jgi:PAS domain S-box-containing protein
MLMFGHSTAEAIGMPLSALVPDELRAAHVAGLARYAAGEGGHLTGSRELIELPALHADGSQFWVELRLAPLDAAVGPRRHVVAVFRDVTTRRQAQADTATALDQLQTANTSLRDFVAMAAHDIRSPIAGVSMALDLLSRQWDKLSEQQRIGVLDGARRHTAFATSLLADLLDVSSIESGELATAPEVCDAAAVLAEGVELAAVDVELQVPTGLSIYADPGHIQRATANLISNAHKYGLPPITVTAQREGQRVLIRVDDHGLGIDPGLQARMFDKFTRGAATSSSKPGAGLGLAIVAGLVRANGGDIRYEELSGGGSRFTCTWPAPTLPQPRSAEERAT